MIIVSFVEYFSCELFWLDGKAKKIKGRAAGPPPKIIIISLFNWKVIPKEKLFAK